MFARSTFACQPDPSPLQPDVATVLRESGCVLLPPAQLQGLCAVAAADLEGLRPTWDRLPRDTYLLDGGRYRFRRHSCFVHELQRTALEPAPHRAHWQPTDYNALHGGIVRWFEPMEHEVIEAPAFGRLLRGLDAAYRRLLEASPPPTTASGAGLAWAASAGLGVSSCDRLGFGHASEHHRRASATCGPPAAAPGAQLKLEVSQHAIAAAACQSQ